MDKASSTSRWIHSPAFDLVFILSPPLVCLLIVSFFPALLSNEHGLSTAAWVLLVLLIDVGHVYSTLYRTYFDPILVQKHRKLLITSPACCFLLAFFLHYLNPFWFWRCLAYLAVWHFIRQQYGFLKLYNRTLQEPVWKSRLQTAAIYAATLYPIVFWHLSSNRQFNWFVPGDFFQLPWKNLLQPFQIGYWMILSAYLIAELSGRSLHIPRLLLITGTALSWHVGIITFNHDFSFTLFNVVSHGIPYMALVAVKSRTLKTETTQRSPWVIGAFYLFSLWLLAYLEEGLWDGWVWKEHTSLFPMFDTLTPPEGALGLSLIVALLSLPQTTHYVLDGYIWRRNYR